MIAGLFALGFLVVGLAIYIIIRRLDEKLWLEDEEKHQFIVCSFIYNGILINTNTIKKKINKGNFSKIY